MILIISSESDLSTNKVIDWLVFQDKPFIRISNDTSIILNALTYSNTEVEFELECRDHNGQKIMLRYSDITSVWYRRSHLQLNVPNSLDFNIKVPSYFEDETSSIVYFIHLLLKEKRHINSYLDLKLTKLEMLYAARKYDLDIPNTFISSSHDFIRKNLMNNKRSITKAIERGYFDSTKGFDIGGQTHEVIESDLERVTNDLYPNFTQELLDKEYEIRSFYLHGQFYSSAIFSQSDSKTKIDFRNYNLEHPNRVVPYALPNEIENKLHALMKFLDLNCGSLDLVVTKDEKFVFLEVNVVGQYEQVSNPCNYAISKIIADYL